MAVDNWTINLECDGKAEGHKHVQREMDRDEICFFNLIDLIEGSGYTSVNYLYYKRKDSLVVIQQDSDVMEMLNECESEKTVNLFVTRQRLATLAPTKSNKEPSKSKPKKNKGQLFQFLGTIARNGGYCRVGAKDWREVKKNNAETIIQFIQTKFLYPHSCEKWILKSIGRDRRKYKATLKKSLFNPKKKKSVLNKRCPDDIDEDQWKALVKYWKSSEGQRQTDPEKKQPHRAKVYLTTHRKRGKGINEPVVLGEGKAGQVHDMGLLPVPKLVYGRRTHHFKDINIVSLDGSSSDVETHMLEEIRQLKEHSRMQDKVIQELKNNQRHRENQEATMGHCARSNYNNSQHQAVLSKRKRVHCVAPNQNDGFLEHRDELNKETCESEYSDDDSLLLSTTSKTTKKQKGHHGGSGETTTIAHQEVAHDKVTCNKRQAPKQFPVMKVGSMVLLMTSKYPNKANVANATLLSTDPEAIVGGVKTGSQFYKVRIDHAIAKDEPLVRPRLGCNNIGDAQSKGVSIAWPSMFVCSN
ncbi:unnamed protein product [Miscanthus lutarioriparius]|uniref:Transposase Tnp1/En/Spm-like domain-containing protein n=1 Tax=Miscanthus lutarioriparius TaxID=422564 RepID=A0A811Q7H3_9POAL|nr:unnamed protein product [Miscanthus lutarioriparius]